MILINQNFSCVQTIGCVVSIACEVRHHRLTEIKPIQAIFLQGTFAKNGTGETMSTMQSDTDPLTPMVDRDQDDSQHVPPVSFQVADFELTNRQKNDFCLHVLTPRAMYWLHANFAEIVDDDFTLTLSQANSFLRHARKNALKTLYKGPNGIIIL